MTLFYIFPSMSSKAMGIEANDKQRQVIAFINQPLVNRKKRSAEFLISILYRKKMPNHYLIDEDYAMVDLRENYGNHMC